MLKMTQLRLGVLLQTAQQHGKTKTLWRDRDVVSTTVPVRWHPTLDPGSMVKLMLCWQKWH